MATDPAAVGQRVLDSLERGRALAINRARKLAAPNELAVRRLLDLDILAGNPHRGRAKRIAAALGYLTERGVRNILERLSSRSDSLTQTRAVEATEGTE